MKNYQIFNAYEPLVRLSELKFNDYGVSYDISLLLSEIGDRYKIIATMLAKINAEYCVTDESGNVITRGGKPVMIHGKSYADYNAEMSAVSEVDARYEPIKVAVSEKTFKDELPSPRDMALLKDFISFERSANDKA